MLIHQEPARFRSDFLSPNSDPPFLNWSLLLPTCPKKCRTTPQDFSLENRNTTSTMGNQQSSEEKKSSGSRSGTPQAEKDRKVNRRISVQALSQGRGTPVNAAATKDTAVAQTTSQHLETPQLQQYLQAASPDSVRSPRVERSSSRKSREKKEQNDMEYRSRQLPPSQPPLAVRQPATPLDVPYLEE